jgi:LysR family transcriptional regulator for bpeEF and oprC
VALRVGALKSSTLVARRIGSLRTITVAAPQYLADHGAPADLDALAGHRLIVGQTDGAALPWRFQTSNGPVSITPSGPIRSNDGEDLRAAALAGLGILHGPSALFQADLQAGRLVRVLQDLSPEAVPIHAVHSSGRNTPARVRVFIDFMTATFADEPSLRL